MGLFSYYYICIHKELKITIKNISKSLNLNNILLIIIYISIEIKQFLSVEYIWPKSDSADSILLYLSGEGPVTPFYPVSPDILHQPQLPISAHTILHTDSVLVTPRRRKHWALYKISLAVCTIGLPRHHVSTTP